MWDAAPGAPECPNLPRTPTLWQFRGLLAATIPIMPLPTKQLRRLMLAAFAVGVSVPVFWGFVGMLLFNLQEGFASRVFWRAVYITCPFWFMEGPSAVLLMPLLNGCLYLLLGLCGAGVYRSLARRHRIRE